MYYTLEQFTQALKELDIPEKDKGFFLDLRMTIECQKPLSTRTIGLINKANNYNWGNRPYIGDRNAYIVASYFYNILR